MISCIYTNAVSFWICWETTEIRDPLVVRQNVKVGQKYYQTNKASYAANKQLPASGQGQKFRWAGGLLWVGRSS